MSNQIIESVKNKAIVRGGSIDIEVRKWRLLPLYVVLLLLFTFIFFRLITLQVIRGSYFREVSNENRIRVDVVKAYRGVIKDRNGVPLARNVPAFSVRVDKHAKNYEDLLSKLSSYIDTSESKDLGNYVLFSPIDRDIAIKVESALSHTSGVSILADPVREYLYPREFAHVVGYVSSVTKEFLKQVGGEKYLIDDKVGVVGIEKVYDRLLHGTYGSTLYEVDASGAVLREISKIEPISGKDITLTIDANLQKVSYQELEDAAKKTGATGGVVVAQDPSTGGVLAMVSFPSFNPNVFTKGMDEAGYSNLLNNPLKPLLNRATMGQYPPGSIFKIVTASAALEEKILDKNTFLDAPGAISVGSFVYRDWKSGGHGKVNVVRALAESADTFFYKIVGGYGDFKNPLGPKKLSLWAEKFGLGKPTGIDLTYEEAGLVPDPNWKKENKKEPWYVGDSYITAIGQGDVLTTPLQVNVMMSVIASGGYLRRPHLLNRGLQYTGFPGSKFEKTCSWTRFCSQNISSLFGAKPALAEREAQENSPIISQKTLQIVKEGLIEACNAGGTGYPFFDFEKKHPGIDVACKTGTSEFGEKNARGEYKTHAWFTVFAPIDNPKIVLTVFLEGGGGGAQEAAPVARKILDYYFNVTH